MTKNSDRDDPYIRDDDMKIRLYHLRIDSVCVRSSLNKTICITQKKGVKIIAAGIGNKINNQELKEIAMGHEENVIHVSNVDNLKKEVGKILYDICS